MIRATKVEKKGGRQGWKRSEERRRKGKEWGKGGKRRKIIRDRGRKQWARERPMKPVGEEARLKEKRKNVTFRKNPVLGLSPGPGRLEAEDLPALLGASAGLAHTALACSSTP